jgi:23S rRNA (cytosine1962-C5)-methyltransferase
MCSRTSHLTQSFLADGWKDYQLLDSGEGMKVERWGEVVLVRPDPLAIWPKADPALWQKWDGYYHRSEAGGGRWEFRRQLPESWTISYGNLKFKIRPTDFKHTGLFPEQGVNWDWCGEKIRNARRPIQVLNLFAYTGAASIACAAAGAQVCHVDASKGMIQWCRDNAVLSGLAEAPIRSIADDCMKFVGREVKRGKKYDAVIMDPPAYGRGASGEVWKVEEHLWGLLAECRKLLSDQPLFFLINSYTTKLSPMALGNLLGALMGSGSGSITVGELGLPAAKTGRMLPCGILGRWEAA